MDETPDQRHPSENLQVMEVDMEHDSEEMEMGDDEVYGQD